MPLTVSFCLVFMLTTFWLLLLHLGLSTMFAPNFSLPIPLRTLVLFRNSLVSTSASSTPERYICHSTITLPLLRSPQVFRCISLLLHLFHHLLIINLLNLLFWKMSLNIRALLVNLFLSLTLDAQILRLLCHCWLVFSKILAPFTFLVPDVPSVISMPPVIRVSRIARMPPIHRLLLCFPMLLMAQRSTCLTLRGGYLTLMTGAPVTWSSKKIKSAVNLSSTEAEYIALSEASKEAIWLKNLLECMKISVPKTPLWVDNAPAIDLAKTLKFATSVKQVDLRYHMVRDTVKKGIVELRFVPTKEQAADILTKILTRPTFSYLCEKLLTMLSWTNDS